MCTVVECVWLVELCPSKDHKVADRWLSLLKCTEARQGPLESVCGLARETMRVRVCVFCVCVLVYRCTCVCVCVHVCVAICQ